MIRAVLFDSDGVLVDTEKMYYEATRVAFSAAGVSLTPEIWANGYLGRSKTSRKIATRMGIASNLVDKVLDRRNGVFWADVALGVQVMPHVRETLAILANHFRLAVVTGASRERFKRVHESTGLLNFFETVITADEAGGETKPSPQPYLAALRILGLRPEECIAVEDSPRGAMSAVAAGIKCCIIPTFLTDLSLCPPECELLHSITQLQGICFSQEMKLTEEVMQPA
ncbi:MAG: HAD family phosphatase [Victivallaceae bacterium]|jgi:beta-phosphoglucomutase-like phosphatase (HAD superfamily)